MRFPIERLTRRIDEVGRHVFRERLPQPVWRILPEPVATRRLPDPADPAWLPIQVGE